MKKVKVLSIIVLFAISGCSVNSGFEQYPNKTLDKSFPVNSAYNINTTWWKSYNDTALNTLIEISLANNIDLAQSAIKVNKALYEANLVGADLVPTFNGSLGGSASKNIKEGGSSNRNVNGSLGISYEIDLWKKLADTADSKEWAYKATEQDLESTRLTLINNVIDSYFNLKYLNSSYSITNEDLKNYQKIYEITLNKFNNGLVSQLEVVQAQQSIDSNKKTLNNLQLQIKNEETILKNLLNFKPNDNIYLGNKDIMEFSLQGVDLNIPVSTIANRPDLRAKEYTLISSFKNKQVAEKAIYPSISISSTLSSSGTTANNMFNVPVVAGNINISLPFLDWNHIKWNTKLSEADYNLAKLDFEKNIVSALNEIDTYYYTYKNYEQNYNYSEIQYKDALKIQQYYKIRYEQGVNELSDWLNAIKTTNAERQSILEAKYKLLSSENNIYKAMAGKYNK